MCKSKLSDKVFFETKLRRRISKIVFEITRRLQSGRGVDKKLSGELILLHPLVPPPRSLRLHFEQPTIYTASQ